MTSLMKQVKKFPAFCNGKNVTVEYIQVTSVMDNLVDHVIFRYALFDKDGAWSGEGSIELKGCDCYDKWDASDMGAYLIVCKKISLELLPGAVFKSATFDGLNAVEAE